MQIAVLADAGSWYFQALQTAAEARGHRCCRWDFSRLGGGVEQGSAIFSPSEISAPTGPFPDVVIVRSMPFGSLEQVVFRMDLLARLEASGVLVVNSPKSLECAIDKYLTTARLAAAGLPVPNTVCCQTADEALEWFQRLGGDVVVKPLFGAEGRGIVRVTQPDMAWRVFTTLERIQAVLYLQRFVDHGGCDQRLLVLGGRVLGGMRRRSADDFRTNVALQGVAEAYIPTERETELAMQAAEVVGTAFAGIDLVYDRDQQPYILEVNAVPGWKAFAAVNQLDIAASFVADLERQVG